MREHLTTGITGWLACATGTALIITALMHGCQESAIATRNMGLTYEQEQYKNFFKVQGSKEPDVMAVAVSHTKNPKLMAAIAAVESGGNPKAVGDSGASKGAFQVQGKHWGKVKDNALEQALQAEKILEELLVQRGRLRCALAAYNGGTRPNARAYKYADRVLRLVEEI